MILYEIVKGKNRKDKTLYKIEKGKNKNREVVKHTKEGTYVNADETVVASV